MTKRKNLILCLFCMLISLSAIAQQTYNAKKLSGYLRKMAANSPALARSPERNTQVVCTLMRLCEGCTIESVASQYGCTVLDSIGGIYFVDIPISQIGTMSLDGRVQRIEAHEMPQFTMNEVPSRIGATTAWAGKGLPLAFTGKGVITGVVDIGFDFTHPMFSDSTGTSRIDCFYDMASRDATGSWGVAYDTEALTSMQHSPRALNQTHGTHVSG